MELFINIMINDRRKGFSHHLQRDSLRAVPVASRHAHMCFNMCFNTWLNMWCIKYLHGRGVHSELHGGVSHGLL